MLPAKLRRGEEVLEARIDNWIVILVDWGFFVKTLLLTIVIRFDQIHKTSHIYAWDGWANVLFLALHIFKTEIIALGALEKFDK